MGGYQHTQKILRELEFSFGNKNVNINTLSGLIWQKQYLTHLGLAHHLHLLYHLYPQHTHTHVLYWKQYFLTVTASKGLSFYLLNKEAIIQNQEISKMYLEIWSERRYIELTFSSESITILLVHAVLVGYFMPFQLIVLVFFSFFLPSSFTVVLHFHFSLTHFWCNSFGFAMLSLLLICNLLLRKTKLT